MNWVEKRYSKNGRKILKQLSDEGCLISIDNNRSVRISGLDRVYYVTRRNEIIIQGWPMDISPLTYNDIRKKLDEDIIIG